jgi:eukaryotic-like serine/threonine-protein kinase
MRPAPVVRLAPFEVDLVAAELRKRGKKVPLQDQPFKVLALLLRRKGELVTREELQRALWPGDTFGEFDEGLNKAIQKLRQALDDSTDKPQFIETLPRKGYRFIAAVESVTDGTAAQSVHEIPPRPNNREVVPWALLAVVSLAAAVLAVAYFRQRPSEAHVVRFQIPPPEGGILCPSCIPAVSPDGRYLVTTGKYLGGTHRLWLYSLDSLAPRPLLETDQAYDPFWSPDSRFVGFFQGNELKKIDIAGGPPRLICSIPFPPAGGDWSPDGTMLFSSPSGLRRVSAAGGEPTVAIGLDKSRKEIRQMWPHFLPDGHHFLYSSRSSDAAKSGVYLASLGSAETRRLFFYELNVAYAPPGFLIFGQQETLMAQPFDERSQQITGDPFPIAEHVGFITDGPRSLFAVSKTGVLAYRAPESNHTQLAWYSRDGKRLGSIGGPGDYGQIVLSPDEERLAVERPDAASHNTNVWILELSSGIFSRLTFTDDMDPVWSPDGHEVLFMSRREDRFGLYRKALGAGEETLIYDSPEELYSENWLPDGKSIVIIDQGGRAFSQVSLSGERKPVALMKSAFGQDEPHVSPDGRWIAYNTTETGRWEVYVATFPGFTGKRQVSSNGGGQALWRKDGKELFYLSLDGKLMAVDVKVGATIETGLPKVLFQTPLVVSPLDDQYCVTADGRRFLIGEPVGVAAKPITVVLNWTAALKR